MIDVLFAISLYSCNFNGLANIQVGALISSITLNVYGLLQLMPSYRKHTLLLNASLGSATMLYEQEEEDIDEDDENEDFDGDLHSFESGFSMCV